MMAYRDKMDRYGIGQNECPLCASEHKPKESILVNMLVIDSVEGSTTKQVMMDKKLYDKIMESIHGIVYDMTKPNHTVSSKLPEIKKEYVCADCGYEQVEMNVCRKCLSFRVILISEAARLFGDDWRQTLFWIKEC